MRHLVCPPVAAVLLAFAVWGGVLAQLPNILDGSDVDGEFESGGAGWTAAAADASFDGGGPVHGGGAAAHVTASGSGAVVLASKYWLLPTAPGVEHTLRIWVYDDDPGIENVTARLEFLDGAGTTVIDQIAVLEGDSPAYRELVVGPLVSLPETAFARVNVRATPLAAGATFHVDSVTLERGALPTPTPVPTLTPTPSPTPTPPPTPTPVPPTPTPAPTLTTTPTATPTSTPGPTPTPSPTPTPAPQVLEYLTNGDFELGLLGWSNVGGTLTAAGGYSEQGLAAVLLSDTGSTKWLSQAVRATPGRWYEATARLRPDACEAWLRVAWYASPDGSGSQLYTEDSATLNSPASQLAAVGTGPLLAPFEARSAQVRVMFRPRDAAFAMLVVDHVRFEPASAPAATATPALTATAAPTATSAPAGTPAPAATAAPAATSTTAGAGAAATASPATTFSTPAPSAQATEGGAQPPSEAVGAASRPQPEALLRITELMPDPAEAGADADYEWVELTNVGVTALSLDGFTLRDNGGAIALPPLTLPPGASIVIAGSQARVEDAVVFRPPEGLSNGLANAGDRLALFSAGARVDALSYGTDTVYRQAGEPALPAPGPGRTLHRDFADDGSLLASGVSEQPSPGRVETPPTTVAQETAAPPASSPARPAEGGGGANRMAWAVLIAVAVGALVAAAVQRVRWLLRNRAR